MCDHSFHWLNSQEAERGEERQGGVVKAQGPPFIDTLHLQSLYRFSNSTIAWGPNVQVHEFVENISVYTVCIQTTLGPCTLVSPSCGVTFSR